MPLPRRAGKRARSEEASSSPMQGQPSPAETHVQEAVGATKLLEHLQYDNHDPRSKLEGFWGMTTASHEALISQLKEKVEESGLDLSVMTGEQSDPASPPAEPVAMCLLRFLRANNMSVDQAYSQLLDAVNWREEEGVAALMQKSPLEVLGTHPDRINEFFPHFDLGEDKAGRPVLCKQYGGFKMWELKKLTSREQLIQMHIWEQEATIGLMRKRSLDQGRLIDSLVAIIDCGGMRIGQVTKDFVRVMKAIATIDQRMYPEMLGQMFIINTPAAFPFIWSTFSVLLDARTTSKIKIMAKPADWQPALLQCITAETLPPEYGGTGAPLAARSSLSMLHWKDAVELAPAVPAPMESADVGPEAPLDGRESPSSLTPTAATGTAQGWAHWAAAAVGIDLGSFWGSRASAGEATEQSLSRSSSLNSEEFFDVMAAVNEMGHDEDKQFDDATAEPYVGCGSMCSRFSSIMSRKRGRSRSREGEQGTGEPEAHDIEGEEDIGDDDIEAERPALMRLHSWNWRSGPDLQAELEQIQAAEKRRRCCRMCWKEARAGFSKLWSPCLAPLKRQRSSALVRQLQWAGISTLAVAFVLIVSGGYTMSVEYWDLTWEALLLVCLGSLVVVLGLMGLQSTRHRSIAGLSLYSFCSSVLSALLLAASGACFAVGSGEAALTNLSWQSVGRDAGAGVTEEEWASEAQSRFILLGAGMLVMALVLGVTGILGVALVSRLGDDMQQRNDLSEFHRLKQLELQLRESLKEGVAVSGLLSIVCLGYGSYAIVFVLSNGVLVNLDSNYMLVVASLALTILCGAGYTASKSGDPSTFMVHLYLAVPSLLYMLCWSVFTFATLSSLDDQIIQEAQAIGLPEEDVLDLASQIKSIHMINAVLQMCSCVCVCITLYASSNLSEHIAAHGCLTNTFDKYYRKIKLSRAEVVLVVWAVLSAFILIFFDGAFAILNSAVGSNLWLVGLWEWWGHVDSRYLISDAFVVSHHGLRAFVAGPLLLVYATGVYTRQSFRHILAICLCTTLAVTQTLYLVTEVRSNFSHTAQAPAWVFWLGFIGVGMIRLALPCCCLAYNIRHLYKRVYAAEVQYAKLCEDQSRIKAVLRRDDDSYPSLKRPPSHQIMRRASTWARMRGKQPDASRSDTISVEGASEISSSRSRRSVVRGTAASELKTV
ncbi:unnamed protein product [Chrysoparadoxa australica]